MGGLFLLGVAAALLFSADLGATRADIARLHDAVADLSDQIADLQEPHRGPAAGPGPRQGAGPPRS